MRAPDPRELAESSNKCRHVRAGWQRAAKQDISIPRQGIPSTERLSTARSPLGVILLPPPVVDHLDLLSWNTHHLNHIPGCVLGPDHHDRRLMSRPLGLFRFPPGNPIVPGEPRRALDRKVVDREDGSTPARATKPVVRAMVHVKPVEPAPGLHQEFGGRGYANVRPPLCRLHRSAPRSRPVEDKLLLRSQPDEMGDQLCRGLANPGLSRGHRTGIYPD